jgi:MarR family transcriptional regulator, 2-MHQ and catechol-resistance regulon repressor
MKKTTKREQSAEENHARAMMQLIHQVTAGHPERATLELNVRQRLVIQSLGIAGGRPIAAIGQQLGLTPSTMTGLVDRLEEQGYLRREAHPSDRRATVLRLTRKGETAFQREVEFYRALVDETLSALGEDAKALVLAALDCLARSKSAAA